MGLTRYEKETTINWNMLDTTVYIYTRMPAVMRHLELKLGFKPVKIHKDKFGNVQGKEYKLPKTYLRLPQKPRQLSSEARKAMADRLSTARKNKASKKPR